MRARIFGLVATATTLLGLSGAAHALPTLQLGIVGGTYDAGSQTIVASTTPFTLVAILTPGAESNGSGQPTLAELLATDFYISAALVPKIGPPGGSFGSFSFDGTTVNATSGMDYGTPPLDSVWDALYGDLQSHDIFATYFSEFGFNFNANQTLSGCTNLNTQNTPGLAGCALGGAGGTQYWASFQVDVTFLQTYDLHFDLYDTDVRNCKKTGANAELCTTVVSRDDFAPFSHDAQSSTSTSTTTTTTTTSTSGDVPEPGTLTLLGLGLLGMGYARRAKKAA